MKRRVPKHIFPERPVRNPRHRRRFTRLMFEPLEDRTMLSVLVVNNGTDTAVTGELSLGQAIAQATTDSRPGRRTPSPSTPAFRVVKPSPCPLRPVGRI